MPDLDTPQHRVHQRRGWIGYDGELDKSGQLEAERRHGSEGEDPLPEYATPEPINDCGLM